MFSKLLTINHSDDPYIQKANKQLKRRCHFMTTIMPVINNPKFQPQYTYNYNPLLLCDFYKIAHRVQYPKGTQKVYSTWIPRSSRLNSINKVVAFGIQSFAKEYLIDYFNVMFFDRPKEEVVYGYKEFIYFTLINPGNIANLSEDLLEQGVQDVDSDHIAALHDLGYVPLKIKAVKEGTLVPIKVPVMTVVNTIDEFFWVTNYFETLFSNENWLPITDATIAFEYLKVFMKYADLTCDDRSAVPFQGHDFSMRGMASLGATMAGGAGHLLSFLGTDTIPAIMHLIRFYNANIRKEIVGTSVNATEHSVMCANGRDEKAVINRLISEVHPSGIVSIVSDTWDFWHLVTHVYPSLKDQILVRDGKVVIRPDSGNPVLILVGDPKADTEHERKGLIECLWEIFGGTVNSKGYKVLDSHIGAIYGDSITLERQLLILQGLMDKGFASSNVVLGIGSYTYQYNTRDTFGFAVKATHVVINGEEFQIYKDPKTDNGMKKSLKGMVAVVDKEGSIGYIDNLSIDEHAQYADVDLLEDVFVDGKLVRDQNLSEIRQILHSQL
ncbi:nicotinate phosphoribosyltransferase [Brevibacillus sp. NPDC058079]|uniref:nicotinate phosphoribosyltransferase n=1 Tax=Brevibacillus sp. NPDC058079 TaxID=3346330 RepID=UPI0036E88EB3